MVAKVGHTGGAGRHGMPTQAQLKKEYGELVNKAFADKTAKQLKSAPHGIEKYASVDITPKFEMGVNQKVYAYKGELYLKSTALTQNPQPSWFKIGPAPMF